jgi:hypothetical protein
MPNLTAEAIYLQLGQLLSELPDLSRGTITPEINRELGRLIALVEHTGAGGIDIIALKSAIQFLGGPNQAVNAQTISSIGYAALARAELDAPAATQGSFIASGNPFDAFASVGKVFSVASKDLLIVDPYADGNLLTDYSVQAPEHVCIRVMTDAKNHKPGLKPAMTNWVQQFGSVRPIQIRLAPPGVLHDRLIIVDGASAYALGQSFNKLATRSPTSIVRANPETGALKIAAYEQLWQSATPI